MKSYRSHFLAAAASVCVAGASPAIAQETSTTTEPAPADETSLLEQKRTADYLDLTASLGYSSNPFLGLDSRGAVFARASARGVHTWLGELSSTSISGFVEGSTYFREGYGLKSIFAVDANHTRRVSENVTLFGSLGVSGDIAGQLSNRFLGTDPIIIDPSLPPPPTNPNNADLFSFSGRQYRLYGQAGASIRVSPRGSVSVSGGVQRWFYTNSTVPDYMNMFGTLSYDHTLSERTTVGASLNAVRTAYSESDDNSVIISPAVTVRTRLAEDWTASGSLGVSFSSIDRLGDTDKSTNLAASGSICKITSERDETCIYVTRSTDASARSSVVTTSSVGLDWARALDENQRIRLSGGFTHYEEDAVTDDRIKSNYWRIGASYDRRINQRLSGGVEASARSFLRSGPDPDADIGATVYVRYRLGDLA